MSRLSLALRCFFAVLRRGRLDRGLAAELGLPAPQTAPPAPAERERSETAADGALRILGLLQREGRLLDFLMEEISAYPDDQVGAAARDVHEHCAAALRRCLRLSPVIDGVEGTYVRLGDLGEAEVKLLGNVPIGARPEGGILRHKGWRAMRIELPAPAGQDPALLAPAEVEVE
ncbi:MAG: DUF2760 domain-containing protein [Bryobacterales bacterium]|nr:DUF2760 domain-containing protein [Bryobacteraceae bacterium]MDW8130216.1 DUF2760 domain-containing protein [Bryobacterales bacterium]